MQGQTRDVLERRASQALGASLPVPGRLARNYKDTPPRGKSGRALTAWLARDAARDPETPSSWHRIPVGRGVELHIETAHPLARLRPDDPAGAPGRRGGPPQYVARRPPTNVGGGKPQ